WGSNAKELGRTRAESKKPDEALNQGPPEKERLGPPGRLPAERTRQSPDDHDDRRRERQRQDYARQPDPGLRYTDLGPGALRGQRHLGDVRGGVGHVPQGSSGRLPGSLRGL